MGPSGERTVSFAPGKVGRIVEGVHPVAPSSHLNVENNVEAMVFICRACAVRLFVPHASTSPRVVDLMAGFERDHAVCAGRF
jgi:hypothetical protein